MAGAVVVIDGAVVDVELIVAVDCDVVDVDVVVVVVVIVVVGTVVVVTVVVVTTELVLVRRVEIMVEFEADVVLDAKVVLGKLVEPVWFCT